MLRPDGKRLLGQENLLKLRKFSKIVIQNPRRRPEVIDVC